MKLMLIVNEARTLKASQATSLLGHEAAERGWTLWVADAGDVYIDGERGVSARARRASGLGDTRAWLTRLREAPFTAVSLTEVDAVLVRTNPARARGVDHDATLAMLAIAELKGVTVHNSARALQTWRGKLSQGLVPRRYRPSWRAASSVGPLDGFVLGREGRSVVKPVVGTQGTGVVRLAHQDPTRIGVLEAMLDGGAVIAQDYLEDAPAGDIRVIALEGKVLRRGGKVAAVGRRPPEGDFRSNVAAGGTAWFPETVPKPVLAAAEATARAIYEAGFLLGGVDIVGGQVVEVNLASPGGFQDIQHFTGIDVCGAVLDAVERWT